MKTILMFAAASLFTLITIDARAVPAEASGQATFTLTAMAQKYYYLTTSIKTNHTATTTNITTIAKSKATNAPVNSAFILNLLENSFNTNFPSDAKLMMRGEGTFTFFVADDTGTNILLEVGSVLSIANNQSVNSGVRTSIEKFTHTGTMIAGNDTETITEDATLTYNDSALTTKDTTHTDFQLRGILMDMLSINIGTRITTQFITLHGAGGGTIQGKSSIILKGTVTATVRGALVG